MKSQLNNSPKTKGILTKVICNSEPNLAILAWPGDELWRRQAPGWHTDTYTNMWTDAGNNNTQNWPRVKMISGICHMQNTWNPLKKLQMFMPGSDIVITYKVNFNFRQQ